MLVYDSIRCLMTTTQTTAAIVTYRWALLALFDSLSTLVVEGQGLGPGTCASRRLVLVADQQYVDDVVAVLVDWHKDLGDLSGGLIQSVIDADTRREAAGGVFLLQQDPDRVAVEGFGIPKIHLFFEARAFCLEGIPAISEFSGPFDGFLNGKHMGPDTVQVDGWKSVSRSFVTAGEAEDG